MQDKRMTIVHRFANCTEEIMLSIETTDICLLFCKIFLCLANNVFDCYFNRYLSTIMTEKKLSLITDKNMQKLPKIVFGLKSQTNECNF